MTYEVLKDFKDESYNLDLHTGDQFIPATIGYPQFKIDDRVKDGLLKLLTELAPIGTVAEEKAPETKADDEVSNDAQPEI